MDLKGLACAYILIGIELVYVKHRNCALMKPRFNGEGTFSGKCFFFQETMLLRVCGTASGGLSFLGERDGLEGKVRGNQRMLSIERNGGLGCVRAVSREAAGSTKTLTGVIFEPFTEVQSELVQVSKDTTQSLARQRFAASCESALNDQINVEYSVSYIYHALFAYFDRDNVGLPGFAKYFKEASDEERNHAEMLMKYQNMRGGRVKLQSILLPVMEFEHHEKGDALYAMELALSLEKLTNEKLLNLHNVAQQCNDAQMTDFIEGNFLSEQVETIKKVSEYVAQLRKVGKGHGVWDFDQMLLKGGAVAGGGAAVA